jgi:hypothetical protein
MSQFHCTSAWVLDELEWRFRYRLPRAFDAKSVDFKFGPSIYQRFSANEADIVEDAQSI